MRPSVLPHEPREMRNGVYSRDALSRPHAAHVMQIGASAVVVLLIAAMVAVSVALMLGALWMIKTFAELLGRHA